MTKFNMNKSLRKIKVATKSRKYISSNYIVFYLNKNENSFGQIKSVSLLFLEKLNQSLLFFFNSKIKMEIFHSTFKKIDYFKGTAKFFQILLDDYA